MAWTDKPSDAQMNMLWYWGKWNISNDRLRPALKWLEQNATKKEVSEEMSRVRELYKKHRLDKETFFDSPVWSDYKCSAEEK